MKQRINTDSDFSANINKTKSIGIQSKLKIKQNFPYPIVKKIKKNNLEIQN
jgi:hypothetical protein